MGKIQKAARLPKDQADRVEAYAEEREITEADALRRLIRVGLDEEEDKPADTGDYLRRDEHPWVDAIIGLVYRSAWLTVILGVLVMTAWSITIGAFRAFGFVPTGTALELFLALTLAAAGLAAAALAVSIIGLAALEYLMHPMEAPIRRYFPTTWPENAGQDSEAES